jgi:hypothetical protein
MGRIDSGMSSAILTKEMASEPKSRPRLDRQGAELLEELSRRLRAERSASN